MLKTNRGKWIFGAFALLFLMPFIMYRLPGGKAIVIEGEVHYQYIDLGQGDFLRAQFEHLIGNRRIFLIDQPWLFVSKSNFDRCWPVTDMKSATYSVCAKLHVYPLLFGGYGLAEIVQTERLNKRPVVTK